MVQVLRRALKVLEVVSEDPVRPHGLGEIAAAAGLNAATCARILKTLVEAGYVEQVAPKKGYRLGVMPYVLASRVPLERYLVQCAQPVLANLAAETGETTLLAVLRQGRRVVVVQVEGGQAVQVRSDYLQVFDPYQTATGRLLLAHLSAPALAHTVARIGLPGNSWPEVQSAAELHEALEQLRSEEVVVRAAGQVVGIASPVRQRGEVAAAVGLYLPRHRFAGEHRERILAGIRTAARAITARLSDPEREER
ncbi:MAG: helix-turn-helix domain-containing protein [Armatimonadota bacterium]|nr:helix-turn-helix domain-containing protein [Armatimonadota bacterium]